MTVVVLAATLVFMFFGCGGSKMRSVNVSDGEYYSEDEYEVLSSGQKDNYCSILSAELGAAKGEFDARNREIEETNAQIEAARARIIPLEKDLLNLDSDIRTLRDQIAEVKELPQTWTVKPDESLSLIASYENVYNDVDKWWKIFEANQHIVEDPYYIFPDTVLVIPRDWPVE
jgi:nucleoid-associated protein YgaU